MGAHDNRKLPIQAGWIGSPSRVMPDPGIIELNVVWKARHENSAYVFQDKIWVVGGHAQPFKPGLVPPGSARLA